MEWAARQWPRPVAYRGPLDRLRSEHGRLVRFLATHREAIRDALGWLGWVLAAGAALFAFWELAGFSVLLG